MKRTKRKSSAATRHLAKPSSADKAAAHRLKARWLAIPRKDRPTQEALGSRFPGGPISQAAISQYMNGDMSLGLAAVIFFAREFSCRPEDIRADLPEFSAALQPAGGQMPHDGAPGLRNVIGLTKMRAIDWRAAAEFSLTRPLPKTAREIKLPITDDISQYAFALPVEDDSMSNPHGGQTYPKGSMIVVDPAVNWRSGDAVIVAIEGLERATFKQIIEDAGRKFLRSLNGSYPPIEWTEKMRVVGVVMQCVSTGRLRS